MERPAELVYPLYVAACADKHEPVIKRGEALLKKKAFGVHLEDPKLINRLFLLFNGTVGAEHIAPDSRVNPGNPALRVRLMSVAYKLKFHYLLILLSVTRYRIIFHISVHYPTLATLCK